MPADPLLDALKVRGKRSRVAPGQALFTEGQIDDRVFLVESGSIEIGLGSKEGQRLTLNVLRPGDVFGEIAMIDGGPRTADAVAREESCVASLDRRGFFALFPTQLDAYRFVVDLLCVRLRWVNRHTERGRLRTARAVLASRLMMVGEQGSTDWILISQEELAESAGITREYTNRLLGNWAAADIVEKKRGAVRILDRQALADLAGECG